jgi:hypothetical protein
MDASISFRRWGQWRLSAKSSASVSAELTTGSSGLPGPNSYSPDMTPRSVSRVRENLVVWRDSAPGAGDGGSSGMDSQ